MKTTLIMVRHGYSISNDLKYFTGNLDVALTDTGIRQAEKCAEYLKDVLIDFIYASDLSRAYATALPVSIASGIPIIKEKNLREIWAGDWEGVYFTDLENQYPESYATWKTDIGRACPDGGETVQAFSERILTSVTSICEKHPGKCILIVTHATPIRVISTVSKGLAPIDMGLVPWCKNASINIFSYENNAFSAVRCDITDHLGDMETALPTNV